MHVVAQKDLPFVGMSHQFVGADHGQVGISVYIVESPPGRRTSTSASDSSRRIWISAS